MTLDAAKAVIPHPEKSDRGGEDAAFCNSRYLGVADGVGGWVDAGIDAGLYSRELLRHVQEILRSYKGDEVETPDPLRVLKVAYDKTRSVGSATCCLVFLDHAKSCIKSANLGDSGFILYRPSEGLVVVKSTFQCHDFNFPLQLGTGSLDLPEHADLLDSPVKADDWILVATDGVWDNVFEDQLTPILHKADTPQAAAEQIAKLAFKFSQDPLWKSPFGERLKEFEENLSKEQFLGGKKDDISVVVAKIKK